MSATLTRRLWELGACAEAVEWAKPYATLQEAWDACDRADWTCWLLVRTNPKHGATRLALCACAETALRYVPAGEMRPAEALAVARRYARGQATDSELAAARAAAGAAAGAAARAAAGEAAGEAARAAAWAAAWEAAGAAARAAARAAAWAAAGEAAGEAALKDMAAIVRRLIPDPENLPDPMTMEDR